MDSVGSQEPHKTKTADFIDPHKEAAMACHAGADFGVLFAFLVENFSGSVRWRCQMAGWCCSVWLFHLYNKLIHKYNRWVHK